MFNEKTKYAGSSAVIDLVQTEFGSDNVLDSCGSYFSGHPVWEFMHRRTFDPTERAVVLRSKLDAVHWQLVTTGRERQVRGEFYPCFGTAPMMVAEGLSDTVYHVTERSRLPDIQKCGLLPSRPDIRHTAFPDTESKIHASIRLETADGQGDGAAFWIRHFAEKYGKNACDYVILKVDVKGLPNGTRIYRDAHSQWGIVLDSLDRVEWKNVAVMDDEEVVELLARCGPHILRGQ